MVVTKTGLLFQNGKDGWARAYDVDTGKVLWKGKTAGQSIGIPAMYESKGRQYVVFMSPPTGPGDVGGAEGGGTGSAPADARPGRTATSRSRCRRSDAAAAGFDLARARRLPPRPVRAHQEQLCIDEPADWS